MIDLDLMEKNIRKVADFFKGRECNIRPHTKVHKTPAIAHMQLEAGAKGIATVKVGEAEVMASAGIKDILITNQIVGRQKIERVAGLSKHCDVKVAVDNSENIEELSKIAQEYETEIGVLVDINVSQFGKLPVVLNRCGVLPGRDAVSLARKVVEAKGLKFKGIMGYEGSMAPFPEFEKRKEATYRALEPVVQTAGILRREGIEVDIVSCGGTGTWNITGAYPGVTEVQAGSYVLCDLFHGKLEGVGLENPLTVITTVISIPYPGKAIADAGLKSIAAGSPRGPGNPEVKGMKGVEVAWLNAEHCHLSLNNPSKQIRIGDRLELIPYSTDSTMHLYDKVYATGKGKVEAVWEILASRTQ
jgi:D-serine deaminase-like pyridoxal phosphate-dependent protein